MQFYFHNYWKPCDHLQKNGVLNGNFGLKICRIAARAGVMAARVGTTAARVGVTAARAGKW